MSTFEHGSDTLLLQRLEDMVELCTERYIPQFTNFLDGRSLKFASDFFLHRNDVVTLRYGGFSNAERCVVGVYPADIYGNDDSFGEEMKQMMNLKGLIVEGSGFSLFSHRDCLGSVLALGLKRETIGDIYIPKNSNNAYMCLTEVAANYLCSNIEFIGRDKVKTRIIEACELPDIVRDFAVISGSVASERLDSIVALATKLSREKAKQLVVSGMVNVNHFEELRSDFQIDEGDVLSIRGYGRFIVSELPGVTKKGRNRVIIHKMI